MHKPNYYYSKKSITKSVRVYKIKMGCRKKKKNKNGVQKKEKKNQNCCASKINPTFSLFSQNKWNPCKKSCNKLNSFLNTKMLHQVKHI